MSAYYNEHDPKAAAWLRELIKEGHIPAGEVDGRDIQDVKPHELTSFAHQHFFAGIGGWALALRIAGWPDSRPVRTGSCPCQPFSSAGRGLGEKDARHLWPVFRDIIAFGTPTVTFGEQVASKAGRQWLSRVRADLEGLGYGVGAADLCAAGVGAPHIRQRLFWVADAAGARRNGSKQGTERKAWHQARVCVPGEDGGSSGLADPDGRNAGAERKQRSGQQRLEPKDGRTVRLGDANGAGSQQGRQATTSDGHRGSTIPDGSARRLAHHALPKGARFGQQRIELHGSSAWRTFDIVHCADGKARRIESGTFPLAHGVSGRVGLLRGYGNAIVPQVAAEFIQAFNEAVA